MPDSPNSSRSITRLRVLLLSLLVLLSVPLRVNAREQGQQHLTTKYFTIYFPAGEEKAAGWYASFVDDVDSAVSDLLGSDPVEGLTLHIYATEAEYSQVNPMAEVHPGIMAHAAPEQKEIGVAVERLRLQPPELARESFRHEMTHVVAGSLSNQNLPIGFQEGLAQYNELSTTRGQEVADAIQAAPTDERHLLSWADLNDYDTFRWNLQVSYAESYTVVAFLASRYGMGAFSRFLQQLRHGASYTTALAGAYGQPVEQIEARWRASLPQFLADGWRNNVLAAYDLAPGLSLYDAGKYAEAHDYFASSRDLYRDLGRTEKTARANELVLKAEKAQRASELTSRARTVLEAHDYSGASAQAAEAGHIFADLNLPEQHARTETIAGMARRGIGALDALQAARGRPHLLDLAQARSAVYDAAVSFAALGDDPHLQEANRVVSQLTFWQRISGYAALVVGAVLLAGACLAAALRGIRHASKRRHIGAYAPTLQPIVEDSSWL